MPVGTVFFDIKFKIIVECVRYIVLWRHVVYDQVNPVNRVFGVVDPMHDLIIWLINFSGLYPDSFFVNKKLELLGCNQKDMYPITIL